jgi:uncharacterized protein (UPF0335 family)
MVVLSSLKLDSGHHISLGPPNQPEKKMSEGSVTADQLRLFIERIERLEEEKKGIADDIRDVYSEAKSNGYDAKIMRQIVRLRKMTNDDRAEMEAVLETYKSALGLA